MKTAFLAPSALALAALQSAITGAWSAEGTVSFARDIQPLLEQSCLPCHNATRAEGGLVLESPRAMLDGGDSGSVLKPGEPESSLLYRTAAQLEKPFMPPEANKAKAPRLTEKQLETLRQWIREGAVGAPRAKQMVAWKPMPSKVASVTALAVSHDGRFVAAARGSHVAVYDLLRQVKDTEFPAHPDRIGALAFTPDGSRLATASHGEVKFWRRTPAKTAASDGLFDPAKATTEDGTRTAQIISGTVVLNEASSNRELARLSGTRILQEKAAETALAWSGVNLEVSVLEGEIKLLGERITKLTADLATVEKERSALAPKRAAMDKTLSESAAKRETLQNERDIAEDAYLAAVKLFKEAEKAKTQTAALLSAASTNLKNASPETRELLKQKEEEAKAESTAATAAFTAAEKAQKEAKEKRDAKQKEYGETVKAHGEAAGAVSSALTLDRNAKNFSEVLAKSEAEKKRYAAELESAKALLAQKESERDLAAKALGESTLPAADGIAFDSVSRVLRSRHTDGSVRAWSALSGVPLPEGSPGTVWEFERQIGDAHRSDSQLTHRVNALAFSPDGKLLATGAGDPSRSGELKLWDPASGTLVCEIPKAHKDAVLSLDFSRDGKLLASGAADRAVRLWEVPSGKLFRNLEAHASHVLSVSLRDDSRRVLSAGADNAVKSWDILRSDVVATFSSFSKEVGFARYLGRGDEFLAASAAPVLRVLRDSGGEVRSTTEGLPKFITATALSADGKLQFIGDASGTVRVLNPEGKVIVAWSHADH